MKTIIRYSDAGCLLALWDLLWAASIFELLRCRVTNWHLVLVEVVVEGVAPHRVEPLVRVPRHQHVQRALLCVCLGGGVGWAGLGWVGVGWGGYVRACSPVCVCVCVCECVLGGGLGVRALRFVHRHVQCALMCARCVRACCLRARVRVRACVRAHIRMSGNVL